MATSLLDDGIELRRSMFLEFRSAADDVRQAAADADKSLGKAVHDYRKALRRTRAILKLFSDELPKGDRREIRAALTDARRALGPARDHAVANDVLGHMDGDAREVAKDVLDAAAASAMASAEIKQLLHEGAARTAAQVELLDTALPQRLDWHVLLDGVRATYGEARRARKAAKKSRRSFHTWRRRCKELGIQLDLLARAVAPQFEDLRKELVDATDDLGDAVDLLMARNFVRAHAGTIDKDRRDLLETTLENDLDGKIRDLRRAARQAFRKKPRVLARRLAKIAKREVTPVAAPPLIRNEEFATT